MKDRERELLLNEYGQIIILLRDPVKKSFVQGSLHNSKIEYSVGSEDEFTILFSVDGVDLQMSTFDRDRYSELISEWGLSEVDLIPVRGAIKVHIVRNSGERCVTKYYEFMKSFLETIKGSAVMFGVPYASDFVRT
jgi:hypothetical protein